MASVLMSPKMDSSKKYELDKSEAVKLAREMTKVELHVHLEGTFLPERVMEIAKRNGIKLPERYDTLEKLKQAYVFKDLFSFLDLYAVCASTLQNETDFEELTLDYLKSAHHQGVAHAEIFVGFQLHMDRGIEFPTVLNGVKAAMKKAEAAFGITSSIILDIDRGKSEDSAIELFNKAFDKDGRPISPIIGVGLAYAENDKNPPSKFTELYKKVHEAGMLATAHAGEAFGPEYVREAIEKLNVHRIDHGVRSVEDINTIKLLAEKKIPLTVCPLSNICLKVYQDLNHHPFKELINAGVVVTVNSDDPAYFGGGINDNYDAVIDAYHLSLEDVYRLGQNSINASRLPNARKESLLKDLDRLYQKFRG
ncbi:MAG TPA: adenosine deaminase [Rhabdochlamydiaceae bacterium]|nr:adenosine deaminase [Rhabdochlamydiaceae bacterium]